MKKVMLKVTAVLLVTVLMLPLLCTAAFAALGDGTDSSVKVETVIYKQTGGVWAPADTVVAGESVKARVFITTDFDSKGASLTLFYDNEFFGDNYPETTNTLVFNPANPLVAAQGLEGDFTKTGCISKESFPLLNIVGSDFYDAHNYFLISIVPNAVPFFEYDGSEWLFEFDLTVLDSAKGMGDIFVNAATVCTSTQRKIQGLNFVKKSESGVTKEMFDWLSAFGYEPKPELVSNPVERHSDFDLETKFFAFDPNTNSYVETDTVAPGSTVMVRVYLDTVNPTGQGQFILFYDKDFFIDPFGNSMFNVGYGGSAFNSAPGSDAADNGCTGEICTNGASPYGLSAMINNGLLEQSVADENNPVFFTFRFGNDKVCQKLNSENQTEWFFEFPLTALPAASGSSEVFALVDTFANPDCPEAIQYGYGNIERSLEGSAPGSGLSMAYWYAQIALNSTPIYIQGEARSISLNTHELTVDKGFDQTLTATILPEETLNKTVMWTSSDTNVVTVNNGVVSGVSAGTATITATPQFNPNSVYDTCTVTVNVPVTGITLTPETAAVIVNDERTLTPEVLPADTNLGALVWNSSDTSVATVDNGVVNAVGPGTAVISVSPLYNPNLVTDSCTFTVSRLTTSVEVTPATGSIEVGQTSALTATVFPADASNKNVVWSSADTSIATVDEDGVVTGVGPGVVNITAVTESGAFQDSCQITVIRRVTGINITLATASIDTGNTNALVCTVNPTDASNKKIIWSTSDPNIATVNSNGVVTGTGPGNATIYATTEDGSYSDSCYVTVIRRAVGVDITSATKSILIGENTALAIILSPSDASNKNVIWATSNPSIATVNSNGVVTGTGAGTATITVTTQDGSFSDTCLVTVSDPIPPKITVTLSQTEVTMRYKKGDLSLTASCVPQSTVTWSSANPKIARVSENGVVTARDMGTTYIIATASDGSTAQCKVTVTMSFWQRLVRWFKILFGVWNTSMRFIY